MARTVIALLLFASTAYADILEISTTNKDVGQIYSDIYNDVILTDTNVLAVHTKSDNDTVNIVMNNVTSDVDKVRIKVIAQ
jgi:hypothetical protein